MIALPGILRDEVPNPCFRHPVIVLGRFRKTQLRHQPGAAMTERGRMDCSVELYAAELLPVSRGEVPESLLLLTKVRASPAKPPAISTERKKSAGPECRQVDGLESSPGGGHFEKPHVL